MARSTVIEIDSSKIRVDMVVGASEVDAAIDGARAVVAQLKTRPLGERQIGTDPEKAVEGAVATRATRAVAERAIREAVEENGLRLAAPPKADIDRLVAPGFDYAFSVVLDLVPELSLSDLDGLVARVETSPEVAPEDVDARIDEVRFRSATVQRDSLEPISEDDFVELSFESFIDGRPYEGNVAEKYLYAMGSRTLPCAFEDGLVGLRSGDAATIEFTVPLDYENRELAGRKARFDVVIGRVASHTMPEADDDFARTFGYESMAVWREKLFVDLASRKQAAYRDACEKAARAALADRLTGDVDQNLLDRHAEGMYQAFRRDLLQQGVSFDDYLDRLGLTETDVRRGIKEESDVFVRENLALESLFRMLGYVITDEDVQITLNELAGEGALGVKNPELFSHDQMTALREMTVHRKATEWLLAHVRFEAEASSACVSVSGSTPSNAA